MSDTDSSVFSRSIVAQQAALVVVECARERGFLNGPVESAPELADSEKKLMLKIFAAIAEKRKNDGDGLDSDTVSSMFCFVFARAAEAVTAYANRQPDEFSMLGLFDGKAPVYADERLTGYFKGLDFPGACAQSFWDWMHSGTAPAEADPLLVLMESLKWCFRLSCHIAVCYLKKSGFRF